MFFGFTDGERRAFRQYLDDNQPAIYIDDEQPMLVVGQPARELGKVANVCRRGNQLFRVKPDAAKKMGD